MKIFRHIANLRASAFTAGLLLVSGMPLFAHAQSQAAAAGRALSWFGDAAASVADATIVKPIVMFILTFSGWILGLAGVFFNWVIIKTVFQFGTYFGTSEGMLTAWGVLRDISNIGLLFGFIFMGVLLILNVDGGGHGHGGGMSAKKAIPRLIIFAVLLNFSLFASQAVIDVSNAFSAQFATLAGASCDSIENSGECANVGISGQIMQMAGIGSIWSDGIMKGVGTDSIVLLGLSLFVIITAMVLIAAGIMLVIRVVILSLLMVTSPIGFAGMVIPGLQGIANRWWHMLISQSFFAPVMLLLIFISLKLAESLNPDGDPIVKAFTGESSGVAGNMQVLVVFAVVIGFMIASLAAAAKMGALGASMATSRASALTLGSVGFVGRRTLGRASTSVAGRIRRSPLGETGFGKQLAGVADYGSTASYSLRNVSGKALGAAGVKVDLGKANKAAGHGYHGIEEKAVKERVEYAKTLRGTRKETGTEAAARAKRETAMIEAEKKAAVEAIALASTQRTGALDAQKQAQDAVATQQQTVASLRAAASVNPQNASLQQELLRQESTLATHERELSQATQQLTQADASLAAAREREATATKATVNAAPATLTSKQRQENYAADIEHQEALQYRYVPVIGGHNVTLAGHANHEAAEKIRSNATKSKLEKALDDIKEATEKAGEKEDDHGGDNKKKEDHGDGGHGGGGGGGH